MNLNIYHRTIEADAKAWLRSEYQQHGHDFSKYEIKMEGYDLEVYKLGVNIAHYLSLTTDARMVSHFCSHVSMDFEI